VATPVATPAATPAATTGAAAPAAAAASGPGMGAKTAQAVKDRLASASRMMATGAGKAVMGVGVAGLAFTAADLLYDPLSVAVGDVKRRVLGKASRHAEAVRKDRAKLLWEYKQRQARQRLQALRAANTQALAQRNPHLFAEVMAGRRLPEDAVVFGGTPRVDLLESVADAMSRGESPEGI
jgi:hypothetical protein